MGDWVKKVKELSRKKEQLIDTDNCMVMTRKKGHWGEVGKGKVGVIGDRGRLDLG